MKKAEQTCVCSAFSYQDHFRREAWTASLMTL